MNLGIAEVRKAFDQIKAKFPADHAYVPPVASATGRTAACVNTNPDGTHCLVGQIMVELGLPLPLPDGLGNSFGHYDLLGWLKSEGAITGYDGAAEGILGEVQGSQDNGARWHSAIDSAWEDYEAGLLELDVEETDEDWDEELDEAVDENLTTSDGLFGEGEEAAA